MNSAKDIDFQINRMLQDWKKEDPPPAHSNSCRPSPVRDRTGPPSLPPDSDSHHLRAIADMIIIAFFYLLRPGEYTAPFTLGNVQIFIDPVASISLLLMPQSQRRNSFVPHLPLSFTTQKNGVPGEVFCCPTLAIAWRVLHLRAHGALHSSSPGLHHRWPSSSLCPTCQHHVPPSTSKRSSVPRC